ncbi:9e458ac3-c004-4a07-966e-0a823e49471d [Thermothielavioides terrestris]
MVYGL